MAEKKHTAADRKIHYASEKECIETQKPKLYEHIMQIDKHGFTINIKVWTVNIYCKYMNTSKI